MVFWSQCLIRWRHDVGIFSRRKDTKKFYSPWSSVKPIGRCEIARKGGKSGLIDEKVRTEMEKRGTGNFTLTIPVSSLFFFFVPRSLRFACKHRVFDARNIRVRVFRKKKREKREQEQNEWTNEYINRGNLAIDRECAGKGELAKHLKKNI